MSGEELDVSVCVFGHGDRQLDLKIRPRYPRSGMSNTEEAEWKYVYLESISKNIQHSGPWDCEFCGKPARVTLSSVASYRDRPEVYVYLHALCSADPGPCRTAYNTKEREAAERAGYPNYAPSPYPPLNDPARPYPLLASCAGCKKDSTADVAPWNNEGLMRCSGCKLTRYCGVSCQRQDWPSHKKFCKVAGHPSWKGEATASQE
ncbi:hypothetical protein PUNSTDRAFT_146920 [Punctularia strigosozonata HHB-11173 SS5]|uniref:MYND-type domain-containing protein n=1 Tax=Punctularia strigosozonata (strain HHB-11173) TaxID=741275 RepID=R7S0N3_PUNST|nr:uncharacterized protein PUNSTDRAFT_146920 [Punctularia strigosozonata HHB-11173 SS5]EIN03763.1 hypothetical protein PUNSTDRAFT_146920 [Punctularia strigosozonata HHB-11173 SS5]